MTPSQKDAVRKAAQSLSDLNMIYAIINLVDNNLMHDCRTAERQILKICKSRSQYLLKKYDKNLALATASKLKDEP